MTRRSTIVSFLCLAFYWFASVHARAASVVSDNFDSNTLSNYSVNGTTSDLSYSPTAGINGGGGLRLTNNSFNASTSIIPGSAGANTSFILSSGPDNKVTLSMMLRYSGSHSGTSQAFLGLASGANMNWGSNTPLSTSQVGAAVKTGINLVTRGGTNGGEGTVAT